MNLYAGIHERSHLRYDVYCSLVKVAGQTDNVNAIFKDITKVSSKNKNSVIYSFKLLEH